VRGQIPKTRLADEESQEAAQNPAADNWGVAADDWGTSSADDWGANETSDGGAFSNFSELEKALDQLEASFVCPLPEPLFATNRADCLTLIQEAESSPVKKKKEKDKEELPKPTVTTVQDDRFTSSQFPGHYLYFEVEPDIALFKKTLTKHEKGGASLSISLSLPLRATLF